MDLATIVTICATTITIIWFIIEMKKENSKVLKRQEALLAKIEEGQREGFKGQREGFKEIAERQREGFKEIAEGQRKWLKEIAEGQSKWLEEIAEGQREGFRILSADLTKISEGQQIIAKILERIDGNTRTT